MTARRFGGVMGAMRGGWGPEPLLAAVVLAVALLVAVDRWKDADRTVTVRGVAEQEVPADFALWPIGYAVEASRTEALAAAIAETEQRIGRFLDASGFDADARVVTPPRVFDQHQHAYAGGALPEFRYRAQGTVLVRTQDVDRVLAAQARVTDLLEAGVVLAVDFEHRPEFLFTGLEAIKPEMIAQATRDARRAAEQFAEDSGARVGGIRRATQGYFMIEPIDPQTPQIKRVRVVTTIDFALR